MRRNIIDPDMDRQSFCVLATLDYKQFTLFAEDIYYPPSYMVVFGPESLNNCEKEMEELKRNNPFIHSAHRMN